MFAELQQTPTTAAWSIRDATISQVQAMFMYLMTMDDDEEDRDDGHSATAPLERDAD